MFTTAAAADLPCFLRLSPTDAARGCAAASSVDRADKTEWVNAPFSSLPKFLARLKTYPCDLSLVAPL